MAPFMFFLSIVVLVVNELLSEQLSMRKYRIPVAIGATVVLAVSLFSMLSGFAKTSNNVPKKAEELRTEITTVKEEIQAVQDGVVVEVVKAKEKKANTVKEVGEVIKLDDKREMRRRLAEMLDEE